MYKVFVKPHRHGLKPLSGDIDKVFREVHGVNIGDERIISFVEALWLCYKGIVELYFESNRKVDFNDIISLADDKHLWIMFTVYIDLRNRGRKPYVNILDNTLSIMKGKEVIEIIVLEESSMLSLNELLLMIEGVLSKGKNVVLGLVDKHGDVTYYQVARTSIVK